MATVRFPENFYTLRKMEPVFGTIFNPRTPDQAALAQIETALTQAHAQFIARKYTDAIQSYRNAQSLIYAQIDPGHLGNIHVVTQFPYASELFTPLLSAALEWMNTLPVQQSVPAVRPRVAVNPTTLGSAAAFDGAGVIAAQAKATQSVNTVADWQYARSLHGKGFARTASFFESRAATSDPNLYKVLSGTTTTPQADASSGAPSASATAPAGATLTNAVVAPGLNFGEFSGTAQRPGLPVSLAQQRTLGS
jgi:hypothetical protein